jgi:hypothetical protein
MPEKFLKPSIRNSYFETAKIGNGREEQFYIGRIIIFGGEIVDFYSHCCLNQHSKNASVFFLVQCLFTSCFDSCVDITVSGSRSPTSSSTEYEFASCLSSTADIDNI